MRVAELAGIEFDVVGSRPVSVMGYICVSGLIEVFTVLEVPACVGSSWMYCERSRDTGLVSQTRLMPFFSHILHSPSELTLHGSSKRFTSNR